MWWLPIVGTLLALGLVTLLSPARKQAGELRDLGGARGRGGGWGSEPQNLWPGEQHHGDDAEGCEAAPHDAQHGAEELGGEAGLERSQLVAEADENIMNGCHAAAERVGGQGLLQREADDDADVVED